MTNKEKAIFFIEHGGYVSKLPSIGGMEAAAINKFAEWLDKDETVIVNCFQCKQPIAINVAFSHHNNLCRNCTAMIGGGVK
jgi:hypothetical protein